MAFLTRNIFHNFTLWPLHNLLRGRLKSFCLLVFFSLVLNSVFSLPHGYVNCLSLRQLFWSTYTIQHVVLDFGMIPLKDYLQWQRTSWMALKMESLEVPQTMIFVLILVFSLINLLMEKQWDRIILEIIVIMSFRDLKVIRLTPLIL